MRAAVYRGPLELVVEERQAPEPGLGELLLRVSVTGVCGTDAAEFHDGPHLYWIDRRPHPHSGHAGPVIPGHELVGRVEAIGPGVTGYREGDLVASGAGVSCGSCRACTTGRTNLCERYWTIGLQRDGGLAELVAVPASTCVAVEPYGLSEDAAGLAQPMAIAAHAVDRGAPARDEDVLVIGTGGIGTFTTYAAARTGARVVACERNPERRSFAMLMGADAAVPPPERPELLARTADVVFEVSGSAAGLALAERAVRRGGRIVAVGLQAPPSTLDLRQLALDEISLVGTVAHRCGTDLPAALALLAMRSEGWSDVAPVAIPLDNVVEAALAPLWSGTAPRLKTLIDPRTASPRPTAMAPAAPSVA